MFVESLFNERVRGHALSLGPALRRALALLFPMFCFLIDVRLVDDNNKSIGQHLVSSMAFLLFRFNRSTCQCLTPPHGGYDRLSEQLGTTLSCVVAERPQSMSARGGGFEWLSIHSCRPHVLPSSVSTSLGCCLLAWSAGIVEHSSVVLWLERVLAMVLRRSSTARRQHYLQPSFPYLAHPTTHHTTYRNPQAATKLARPLGTLRSQGEAAGRVYKVSTDICVCVVGRAPLAPVCFEWYYGKHGRANARAHTRTRMHFQQPVEGLFGACPSSLGIEICDSNRRSRLLLTVGVKLSMAPHGLSQPYIFSPLLLCIPHKSNTPAVCLCHATD